MEKSPKEKRGWPICKSASGIEGVHKNALESIHFCKTPWLTGMHIKEKGKCRQFEEKIEKQQRRQKSCYCPHKWLTDVS